MAEEGIPVAVDEADTDKEFGQSEAKTPLYGIELEPAYEPGYVDGYQRGVADTLDKYRQWRVWQGALPAVALIAMDEFRAWMDIKGH